MSTGRRLRKETASAILRIVSKLDDEASFRRVLLEARRGDHLKWHRTLRRYLDLLVLGGALKKRLRDVGSVYPMEQYSVKSPSPRICVGLSVLRLHGLNWDIERPDMREISSDLGALVRARITYLDSRLTIAGSPEDCIAYELKRDSQQRRGTIELLAALLATKHLDLAYLFERGDHIGVGGSLRALFKKILKVFSSSTTEANARTFLETRRVFLGLVRQYSYSGTIKLAEVRGRGTLGLNLVRGLSEVVIVNAAGKQLGVAG